MNYYNEIKNELINNEVYKKVKDYSKNKHDLQTYYNVGKLLIEAQGGEARAKYGNRLIKEYSKRLTNELGKGYTMSSLKRMRQFYLMIQKGAPLAHQLTWSHYQELITINDIVTINYYIKMCISHNLSKRKLREIIKNKEYERLPEYTKNKLINNEINEVQDLIKDPIIIKNKYNYENVSEKVLKQLILEDLDSFLLELGEGFTYISNEYKIKLGNRYNYIDLLLFNIKFNCYIVIELKVTELKSEHVGQIEKYMNYIDKNIKTIYQDKTIGIIICKKNNTFVIEYASDDRIFSKEYVL